MAASASPSLTPSGYAAGGERPVGGLPTGVVGVRWPSAWLLLLPLGVLLAFLPLTVTVPLVAALAGAAVILAQPRWGLYALALTVPYQSGFTIGDVSVPLDFKLGQVNASITEGVVALVILGWVTQLASAPLGGEFPVPSSQFRVQGSLPTANAERGTRDAGLIGTSPLLLAVGVLLTALVLSVLVARDLSLAAKELLKWLELAAVYLAGTSLLRTRRQRWTLVCWLGAAAASQAVLGLVQSVQKVGPEHFMIGGLLMRAYGTFEQPNPFAGYLGLTLPLVVSLYLFGLPPGRWRWLAAAAAVVLGTALLISLSRGAWTAQAVALLLVTLGASRAARRIVLTFGVLGLFFVAGVWPLLPPEMSSRLVSIVGSAVDLGSVREATITPENWAVLERLSQWHAGWQMFYDNPLLGVGIGNYNAAYDDYRLDQWPVALGHAHNHYLTVAAEAGFLGFLGYITFLATAFYLGIRAARAARRVGDRLWWALAIGILGGLAAFATHNLFDVLFVHGMGVTVGLLLALLEATPDAERRVEITVDD